MKYWLTALTLIMGISACQNNSVPEDTRLVSSSDIAQSVSDETALHVLSETYVEGWKLNGTAAQKAAVMPLFSDDAVVIPSGGRLILTGHKEIESFWFPEGAPPTMVPLFEHEVEAVSVSGERGTFHGISKLQFEYAGTVKYQEAVFLAIAKKSETGHWTFTHFMWTDKPS